MSRNKLFDFDEKKNSDFIEIGKLEGDLSSYLVNFEYNLIFYVKPNKKRFQIVRKIIYSTYCHCQDIYKIDFSQFKPRLNLVTVIMQDIIVHISQKKLKDFYIKLYDCYVKVYFIGSTPNLKSLFGLRSLFGDNKHIYRFTNFSLRYFLGNLGFDKINISNENFKITGILSLLRYFLYLIIIYTLSLMFAIFYVSWEGLFSPNLVFRTEKI